METLAKRKISHNKSLGWAPSFILPTWQMVTGTRCWGHRTRLELHGTDTLNQVINYKQSFVSSIISCTWYKRKLAWPWLKLWKAFRVQMRVSSRNPTRLQFTCSHVIVPSLNWDPPHSSFYLEISQLSERHCVLYLRMVLLLWFSLQWCNQLNEQGNILFLILKENSFKEGKKNTKCTRCQLGIASTNMFI